MDPESNGRVFISSGKFGHRHTEKATCVGRRWEGCVHKLKDAKDCREPPGAGREAWDRFSLRASEGTSTAYSLITAYSVTDFWPPALGEDKCLLFEAAPLVIIVSAAGGRCVSGQVLLEKPAQRHPGSAAPGPVSIGNISLGIPLKPWPRCVACLPAEGLASHAQSKEVHQHELRKLNFLCL